MSLRRNLLAALMLGLGTCGSAISADVTAPTPHAGQPVLLNEHRAMLDLVRAGEATNIAVAGGKWSDGRTWKDGRVPAAGAIVLVPKDVAVIYDVASMIELRAIRVEGTLAFDPATITRLSLDTLLVAPSGKLEIGTADRPVRRGQQATIIFTDSGPLDTRRDPGQLGRGLISHGSVSIHGDDITPFVLLAKPPHAGDTKLLLAAEPKNWAVGDRLVLPAVNASNRQDEELTIRAIAGREVTVQSLKQDHVPPEASIPLAVPLANLMRTVVFTSANPAADRAGHVMFMHSPNVSVSYASFERLGRTDKKKRIDDPKLDTDGKLIAGSGTNPRGRYSLHFHRTGVTPDVASPQVVGCVVADSIGWGFVNHSSRVDFRDCVSYRVFGSGFVTEAGDETGSFVGDLAIRGAGSGEGEDDRREQQDFAHEGDGFWFQGPGVAVRNNIACGQGGTGFIFFTQGLKQDGLGSTRFPAASFADPGWKGRISSVFHKDPEKVNDPDTVPVILVPITGFHDNVAFACQSGIVVRFHTGSPDVAPSIIEKSTVWNCEYGAKVRYTPHLVLRDLHLIGGWAKNATAGVSGTLEGEQDIRYENLVVEGWDRGIHVPEAGTHRIVGGTWTNLHSIHIPTPYGRNRRVFITGDVRFGDAPAAALHGGNQLDFDLAAVYSPLLSNNGYRDPNVLFAPHPVKIDTTAMKGQLYYAEQLPDYVPFAKEPTGPAADRKKMGNAGEVLPAELMGKTNRQLQATYGLSIAGAVAPDDAKRLPRMNGLFGAQTDYPPERFPAQLRSGDLHGYRLAIVTRDDAQKKAVKGMPAGEPAELKPGWNLITRMIDGTTVSVLIFGGGDAAPGKPGAKGKGKTY